VRTLVLVVTRRCTQRCTYCPVAKEGWPDMSIATAGRALRGFVERFGGGEIKVFGGEPLLCPQVVKAVCEEAVQEASISKITLCTNGALLDDRILDSLEAAPKLWLNLSLDGRPEDHLASRHTLPGKPDALTNIEALLPRLRRFQRVVVAQVISPDLAERAAMNFEHLLSLGFRRFNLLPASWVLWSHEQLDALRASLEEIATRVRAEWRAGRSLYLHNLFIRSPQPTFTSGVVVDVDGRIYPSDCMLANLDEQARADVCCGSVESPPREDDLREHATLVPGVLERYWPSGVVESTRAADRVLDGFYRPLMREYLLLRRPLFTS